MDRLEHVTTALVLFALLLIALPLMELAGATWPMHAGNAEWRFGAVGLLSNTLLLPMLGSAVLVVVAALADRPRLRRAMAVINAAAAVILLVLLPLFALDSLELRSRIPAGATFSFDVAALKAMLVLGFALVVLAAFSRGGFASSKRDAHRGGSTGSPVVMPGQ